MTRNSKTQVLLMERFRPLAAKEARRKKKSGDNAATCQGTNEEGTLS